MPDIKIVEVGPRDGLQNESNLVSHTDKIEFINLLSLTGLTNIEVTSFVSAKKVPQLADAKTVFAGIKKSDDINYSVLVPNDIGFQEANAVGVKNIAVFGAVSESFSQSNINCSIAESIERFRIVIERAKAQKLFVRAYLSCVFGCPYEGQTSLNKTLDLIEILLNLGCDEISLGDTIGTATPRLVKIVVDEIKQQFPIEKIALHFHDTYGQALANIYCGLIEGITIFDSSVAGLGGCPYAKGATGNIATEDVVYMLQGLGLSTGVNLENLIFAGSYICDRLQKPTQSKVAKAILSKSN